MKILELFSGTESFSKIAEARGHEVFTIDINPKFNPSLCKDVLLLKKEDVPFAPDLIWASPPCTEYSHAKRGGERDIEGANKNVLKAIELIKEFNPKFWIIENPQTGLLKNQSFMQSLPFADASYCKYGMTYRKQTRFWNNFNLKLSTCNKDCDFFVNGRHIDSVGNGRKKYAKFQRLSWETKRKYAVPEKLCLVILKSVEQLIANSPTLPNGNPNGEFNKGDKVSATPTPKCPTDTSHHPNIKQNSSNCPGSVVGSGRIKIIYCKKCDRYTDVKYNGGRYKSYCYRCGNEMLEPIEVSHNKKRNWAGYCVISKNRNQCSEKNCILFHACLIKDISKFPNKIKEPVA